jgi:hypothetical protein
MGYIFPCAQSAVVRESTSGRGATAPILLLAWGLLRRPDRLNPGERAASAYYTKELVDLSFNQDVMERKIEKSLPFAGIEPLFSDRWVHSSVNIVAETPQAPSSLFLSPLAVTRITVNTDKQTVAGEVVGAQARCAGPRITLRLLREQRGDKFVVHFWRNQVVGTSSRVVSRSNDVSKLVAVSVRPFIALWTQGLPYRPAIATRDPHTFPLWSASLFDPLST